MSKSFLSLVIFSRSKSISVKKSHRQGVITSIVSEDRRKTSRRKEDSCDIGQCLVLYFKLVEGKVARDETQVAFFTELLSELELDRAVMEVFQEGDIVQSVLRKVRRFCRVV